MLILRFTSPISLILLALLCGVRFNTITCCHDRDRSLLLNFKQGVVDPSNRLSSWSSLDHDCCNWEGVTCDDNNRVWALYLGSYHHSKHLRGEINLSSLLALQFLQELYLGNNDFERISVPSINHTHFLPNSSMLSYLDISRNTHLRIHNLHYWLSLLPSLSHLDLRYIHLPHEKNWVQSLASLPLEGLHLYGCNLTGSILSLPHANFSSSLYRLNLGLNDFRYGLPNWLLFNLTALSYLDLSQCQLSGQIPDFSGYQDLFFLDLSTNNIKGSIPYWLGQVDHLLYLDLSDNSFHGSIPSNLLNLSSLRYLNISFNLLSGPLLKFHRLVNGIDVLDLAYNSFSGPSSSLLCQAEANPHVFGLWYLDLSNNYLTQELPDCWSNWTYLSYIYLGNNQLVGQVPSTMGSSLFDLRALDLHNNGFSGDMPQTFRNLTSLVLLDLEANHFSGTIQTWIPQTASVLQLRSNQFTGNIPSNLCSFPHLIVLDLANNTLSGPIPHCLLNMSKEIDLRLYFTYGTAFGPSLQQYMKIDLHPKGQRLEYGKNLKLVRSIDLSANKLSGEIPVLLFKLGKLKFLNLSCNYLKGEIPEQIGEMKELESHDLSNNSLHGNIPQTMSSLYFLSVLNLSYNHFSGQIPLGTQLQSFEAWSYIGNPELCGAPLPKNCTIPDNTEHVEGDDDDDDAFLKSLYLGMGVGFAVGFWVVCGSLFLNRRWRHTYFRFFHVGVDRIYVIVAINLRRFR